jgi:hypothetical protein
MEHAFSKGNILINHLAEIVHNAVYAPYLYAHPHDCHLPEYSKLFYLLQALFGYSGGTYINSPGPSEKKRRLHSR